MGEAATAAGGSRWQRPITLAVVLLASTLAVLGLSSAPVALGRFHIAVGITGVAVIALVVDAFQRHAGPGMPRRALIQRGIAAAVLLLPLFFYISAASLPEQMRERFSQRQLPALRPDEDKGFAQTVDHVLIVLLILLVVGAVLWSGILGILISRIRLAISERGVLTPGAAGDPVGSQAARAASRAEALRRSAAALAGDGDARAAVIAAYVALQDHLEGATPRLPTETAHEFVARVLGRAEEVDAGHVHALLAVFAAARFSALPISEEDADQARHHLQALVGR